MQPKKYKVTISIFNLLNESQAEVVRLQQYSKGLTAIVLTSTWLMTNSSYALIVGIAGFVIDTVIACLYFEKLD